MARVSKEYLEARRRQILQAAQRRFSDEGFHETSMLDIVREAGVSAGAVYRYFPSKNDIIATVARDLVDSSAAEVGAVIDASMAADPLPAPEELFDEILRSFERHADKYKLLLQVQIGAVSLPAVGEAFLAGEARFHQILSTVVEAYQRRGVISPRYDAEDIGAALAGLLQSARGRMLDAGQNAAYRRGVRAFVAALTVR